MDRYSNWLIVEKAKDGSKGLINCLRNTFTTFGVSEELASDGGTEFTADETKEFLSTWAVHHRLSSVAFAHSNSRAEIAVKSAKRMISSNTGPRGTLNLNAFQMAVLQHRNTPDPITKLSPAECVFGRKIRDLIPVLPNRYEPHGTWKDTLDKRELALKKRHMKAAERWSQATKQLPQLEVGDSVRIQNQVGPHPTKWDKTGTVVQVKQFDQYIIKVDGSGRTTLRNRKCLRKFEPVVPRSPKFRIDNDLRHSIKPAEKDVPVEEKEEPLPQIEATNNNPKQKKAPLALRRLATSMVTEIAVNLSK